MSVVVWFKRQDDPDGADDDRLYLLKEAKALDKLADGLGVAQLSSFFDGTESFAQVSDEDLDEAWIEANQVWHDPESLLATLEALHARCLAPEPLPGKLGKVRADLVEELAACITRAGSAGADGVKVQLRIVM